MAQYAVMFTAFLCLSPFAAADIRVNSLLHSQQPATGFPPSAVIASGDWSSRPLLNQHGVLVFTAGVIGGGVTPADNQGMWLADEAGLRLLVRAGDPVPGLDGSVFHTLYLAGLSADEQVWFLADLLEFPTDERALCSVRPGEPVRVVTRVGDPVPGLPGQTWSRLYEVGSAANSHVNTTGDFILGGDTNMGISGRFLVNDAGIVPMLMGGDSVPDVPNATFVGSPSSQWSNSGVLTVASMIAGPNIFSANDTVVISIDSDGAHLLARESALVPNSVGICFGDLFLTQESSAPSDCRGFESRLRCGATSADDFAVFWGVPGEVSMIYREGQTLPGGSPTVRLGAAVWAEVNAIGAVFLAWATDGVPAIYYATPATVVRLVRIGDPVPSAPDGVTIDRLDTFTNDGPVRTSEYGRIAIRALTSQSRLRVLATDRLGILRDVCGTGDSITLPNSSVSVIGGIRNFSINDSGQIAVSVLYTSPTQGTGIVRVDVGCPSSGCDATDIAGQDCQVTIEDLALLLSHFGESVSHPIGDIDRDGDVGLADLALMLSSFGRNCAE